MRLTNVGFYFECIALGDEEMVFLHLVLDGVHIMQCEYCTA